MSGVSSIAKGVVLMCDAINMFKALQSINQENIEEPWVHRAYLINRVVILAFCLAEMELQATGAKAMTLLEVKLLETLPRSADIIIRLFREFMVAEKTPIGILRSLERGCIAPFADIALHAAETSIYMEKRYLEMTPEELAKAKRPYPVNGREDYEWRPVDLEECKRNIEESIKIYMGASAVRGVSEVEGIGTTIETSGNAYFRLARYFQNFANFFRRGNEEDPLAPAVPPPINPGRPAEQAFQQLPPRAGRAAPPLVTVEPPEFWNVQSWPSIPEPLHEDKELRKIICPITRSPVKDPVADSNGIIYEKEAIYRWIDIRESRGLPITSPATNLPLVREELVEKPALKAFIDHRLRFHQTQFMAYLNSSEFKATLEHPVDPLVQQEASLENPRLELN